MIRSGICSLTLSKLPVETVVDVVKRAGLAGIEWWGKDHVPHGDTVIAAKVKALTESAGLEVSSYGSYYKAGISESEGLRFSSVLETAVALNAPTIRVWASNCGFASVDSAFVTKVVDDSIRIGDLAAKSGRTITFEFHRGTLTDTGENARQFAAMLDHPAIFFSWQPPLGVGTEDCLSGLEGLLPRLGTIHVYHWTVTTKGGFVRQPLASGVNRWRKYFKLIGSSGQDHFALLEFVKDDSPEQVIKDAKILEDLIVSNNLKGASSMTGLYV